MSIDEAIEKHRRIAETKKTLYDACILEEYNRHLLREYKEHEQLAEWLEELKDYQDKNKMVVKIDCANSEEFKDIAVKLAKEQYNKAIDDYKSGIKEELERFEVKNLDTCVLYNLMDRKAERLKAGGENDITRYSNEQSENAIFNSNI